MRCIGSGRQWTNTSVFTADCKKLNVLELNRVGALRAGLTGHIKWSDDNKNRIYFVP